MKRTLIALCLALYMGLAPALEQVGNTLIFSDDDIAKCIEGGGCTVVTRAKMLELETRATCILRGT